MTRLSSRFAGLAAAGIAALLLSAPATAQTQAASGDSGGGPSSMTGFNIGGTEHVDPATAEKRREIEEAYKRVTKSQPTQAAASNDPWANMRGADEQKPASKAANKTAQKKRPAQ
jgi:hypothetical protein